MFSLLYYMEQPRHTGHILQIREEAVREDYSTRKPHSLARAEGCILVQGPVLFSSWSPQSVNPFGKQLLGFP